VSSPDHDHTVGSGSVATPPRLLCVSDNATEHVKHLNTPNEEEITKEPLIEDMDDGDFGPFELSHNMQG